MSDVSCAVLMPLAFAKKASGIMGINYRRSLLCIMYPYSAKFSSHLYFVEWPLKAFR